MQRGAQDREAVAGDDVDVVTGVVLRQQWQQVGVPVLPGLPQTAIFLTWDAAQGAAGNAGFLQALRQQVPDMETPIYFLCRSGGRSRAAAEAATALGYNTCFNVLGGFESPSSGWVASGLPSRLGQE